LPSRQPEGKKPANPPPTWPAWEEKEREARPPGLEEKEEEGLPTNEKLLYHDLMIL